MADLLHPFAAPDPSSASTHHPKAATLPAREGDLWKAAGCGAVLALSIWYLSKVEIELRASTKRIP